jgi:hypothetical protein
MSGYTAEAWRTIASGGRWTIAEVQKACHVHHPKLIQNAVMSMATSGMLIRYEGERIQYGVTEDCTIPRGMTLREVLKVMADV